MGSASNVDPGVSPSAANAAEVRAHVEQLMASPLASSARLAQLLRYLVERTLAGEGDGINEYAIGVDVFGRPPSFDPRLESIVRTEFSRLRRKLKEYYAGEGRTDRLRVDFPQRGYIPAFTFREPLPSIPRESPPIPASRRTIGWRWAWAVGVVGLALVAAWVWKIRSVAPHPIDSLVVLPFQNLSPDHQDDYLADGVTEELTNDLAQWKDVRVVARTSAFLFKGKAADIRDVGRKLNVDSVIEGSFARQGDRIRITAQLNRTSDGYHVWSHSYETRTQDIMAVQDEIAQSIASAVRGGGREVAQVRTPGSTKDPEAHDLYLRGSHEGSLNTPDSYWRSLALFQEATQKDPTYVNAYVGIARVEISLIHLTQQTPQQAVPIAKAALENALALNPSSGEARGVLASMIEVYDWDWPRAEREFRWAIADGAQAPTHSLYGSLLATRGRFREAQAQLRIAQDMDPLGMGPRYNQSLAFYLEHNYPEWKRVLRGMLDVNPGLLDAHFALGLADAFADRDYSDARRELEWCARKLPAPVTKFGLALEAAEEGRRAQAREYIAEALRSSQNGYISPYQLAITYAALGDKEAALSNLEKSADAREMQILYLKYEPLFDGIRSDPRFIALERRVGLLQ